MEDKNKNPSDKDQASGIPFNPKVIGAIADEVARTLISRLPGMIPRPRRKPKTKKQKRIENAIFLDTSAIVDGRIFDVIALGILNGVIIITDSILMELKRLADAQDAVKRERGRKGLEALERLKKTKKMKVVVIPDAIDKSNQKNIEVDERLIQTAKHHKGKVITCDYNLEKKANIQNVIAINVNALSNALKIIAVPGEALHIKILHQGKDTTQGVGYLEDGTMIVVESGSTSVGRTVDVVVSRVIQTATGRILFAKRI